MSDVLHARAINTISYIVNDSAEPPVPHTYSYTAGEFIGTPISSVVYNDPMQHDDPYILSGDLVPLTEVTYIKTLLDVSYTNDGTDYVYVPGELVHNPVTSDTTISGGGTPMVSDDPLFASGHIRLTEKIDFPVPFIIDPYNNVYDSTDTLLEVGKVIGTVYLHDVDVLAHYSYKQTDQGPEAYVIYCDRSTTYPDPE